MNVDNEAFRKRALSLEDWLDADGEHSTSDGTPDDSFSLGIAMLLLRRDSIIHLIFCVGSKGTGKRRCDHELEGDTSDQCKVCIQRMLLYNPSTFPKRRRVLESSHRLRCCRRESSKPCQIQLMTPEWRTASRHPARQTVLYRAKSGLPL